MNSPITNATFEPMTTEQAVGARIKRAREALGMKVDELADSLGVTPQSVRNWEAGTVSINLGVLQRLSITLNVTVEYLMCFRPENFGWRFDLSEEQRRAIHHAESVDAPNKFEAIVVALVDVIEDTVL